MKKYFFYLVLTALLVAGCGSTNTITPLRAENYQISYQGNTPLEKSLTPQQDWVDVIAIYTESGVVNTYQDSLLVTENYDQGNGVLVYAQEAMTTLKAQKLVIEAEKELKFVITCEGEKKSINLVSYAISSGFIEKVPKLYMTNLFVEGKKNTILLRSHQTEDAKEQQQMIKAFQTIACVK